MNATAAGALDLGPVTLHPGRRHVFDASGARLQLTAAEFDLLLALAQADGRPVTHEALSRAALRHGVSGPQDRSLGTLVCSLRRKLPRDEDGHWMIQSVRSVGYWMRAPNGAAA